MKQNNTGSALSVYSVDVTYVKDHVCGQVDLNSHVRFWYSVWDSGSVCPFYYGIRRWLNGT